MEVTVLAVVVVLALIIAGPLLIIWSVNALLPSLAVPYTWETWLAVVILGAFFRANVTVKRQD